MKRTLIFAAAGILTFTFVVRGQARQGRTAASPRTSAATFQIVEATIPEMQAAMKAGRLTSRALVANLTPSAAEIGHAAIAEPARGSRRADRSGTGSLRSPRHPIALKDLIQPRYRHGALALGYTRRMPRR